MNSGNINIEYYRVFCEVAKRLSFSAAATALFITQPAVSQTINALESALGTKLFIRTSKGVSLTQEGEQLLYYVEPALNLFKTGESKINELLKLESGEVKIAAADTISKHYLTPYLEQYNRLFPEIKIKVINRTTTECIDLIKSATAEIAFVNLPIKKSSRLKITKCLDVNDVFVAGEKYAYLYDKNITAEELSQLPLIMLEPKSNSRRYVDKYFTEQAVSVEPEIELGSHDLLLEFCKIGLGISCVVKEFANPYLNNKELFEIKLTPPIKKRSIGMAVSSSIPLSRAAERFVEILNK